MDPDKMNAIKLNLNKQSLFYSTVRIVNQNSMKGYNNMFLCYLHVVGDRNSYSFLVFVNEIEVLEHRTVCGYFEGQQTKDTMKKIFSSSPYYNFICSLNPVYEVL